MTEPYRQSRVSRSIWPWPSRDQPDPGTSGRGRRRLKLGLQLVAMTGAAALLGLYFGHRAAGVGLVLLALYVGTTAVCAPRAYDAFQRLVGRIAQGVGVALTWGLLTPFFFLAFVPSRVWLLLRRKDPMTREFPTDESSYWAMRAFDDGADRYRKQF